MRNDFLLVGVGAAALWLLSKRSPASASTPAGLNANQLSLWEQIAPPEARVPPTDAAVAQNVYVDESTLWALGLQYTASGWQDGSGKVYGMDRQTAYLNRLRGI